MRGALLLLPVALAVASSEGSASAGNGGGGSGGWPLQIGDPGYQDTTVIAADPGGDVVVAGSFEGSVSVGGIALVFESVPHTNAVSNTFLAKLAPDGSATWVRQFEDSITAALAIDATGRIAMGGAFNTVFDVGTEHYQGINSNDGYIAVFDPSGEPLWSRSFIGAPRSLTLVTGAAFSPTGQLYLVGDTYLGDFGGGALPDNGFKQAFLAAYAPDGSYLWAKQFGTSKSSLGARAASVTVDAAGNAYITGQFFADIDFGMGMLTTTSGSELDGDAFVASFDPLGHPRWSKTFGSSGADAGISVAVGPTGAVYVAGVFSGSVDFGGTVLTGTDSAFVVALDGDGNVTWQVGTKGGFGYGGLWPLALAAIPSGGVWLGGGSNEALDLGAQHVDNAGSTDAFLAKLADGGAISQVLSGGDANAQWIDGMALTSDALVVSAPFEGTLTLEGSTLTSLGYDDIGLWRLTP